MYDDLEAERRETMTEEPYNWSSNESGWPRWIPGDGPQRREQVEREIANEPTAKRIAHKVERILADRSHELGPDPAKRAIEYVALATGRPIAEEHNVLKEMKEALEKIAAPYPEKEGDWGATYDWHKSAVHRRNIARVALARLALAKAKP